MIGRIRGTLIEKIAPMVLVEAFGVGYEILVPMSSLSQMQEIGCEVILYTHFIVREDMQQLYGFTTKTDRKVFQELIKVNGIGAKMALAILSGLDVYEIMQCIQDHDVAFLCRIPGIGKKTAERLIIEMKDKSARILADLGNFEGGIAISATIDESDKSIRPASASKIIMEAVNALEILGYKRKEAESYVSKVKDSATTVEEMIKLALKHIQK